MAPIAIDPFDCESDSTTLGERWADWLRTLEIALVAFGITEAARKRAMLLHLAGKAVIQISATLTVVNAQDEDDYTAMVRVLTAHFTPANNTQYNKYIFRQAKQGTDETIDQFHVRLKKLSVGCGFADNNVLQEEILTQIIHKCKSTGLREKALRSNPPLTLAQLLERERATERTKIQIENIEGETSGVSVNRIARFRQVLDQDNFSSSNNRKRTHDRPHSFDRRQQDQNSDKKCSFCGGEFHQGGLNECPARGHFCHHCNKYNHFPECCIKRQFRQRSRSQSVSRSRSQQESHQQQSQQQQQQPTQRQHTSYRRHFRGRTAALQGESDQSTQSEEEEESECYVLAAEASGSQPRVNTLINGAKVNLLVDTGSSVTIIDYFTYMRLGYPKLQPTRMKIRAFKAEEPIEIRGVFTATISSIKHSERRVEEKVYLPSDAGQGCVLSYKAAARLGYVEVSDEVVHAAVHSITNQQTRSAPETSKSGSSSINKSVSIKPVGKIKDILIKLHIDTAVRPVAQPHRRISHPFRELAEAQIYEHIKADVIEPAVGPTPWINNLLFVKKPPPAPENSYRICIDMREANRAILRERHLIPTIDDLLAVVSEAKWFSVIDLNQAFHQLELHPDSRYITTFSTHIGLFRYKRLFFGLNAAPEIFHNVLRVLIAHLRGVLNSSDDILVFGPTKKEHDENLAALMQLLKERNVTVNGNKDQICQQRVNFHGMVLTSEGLEVDPKKVAAIQKFPAPESESEVRSLLGMANYCARFIRNYSDMSAPLRQLITKSKEQWTWSADCQKAFEELKTALAKVPNLAYFSNSRQTELVVDASPIGLGAILCQVKREKVYIIAFASKALSPTEQRYSQLEREAFAIIWGCEHFQLYLLGSRFVVWTDHKALVSLFNKPSAKLSIRMERWMLRKQAFDMVVQYLPGEWNAADYLSRHPSSNMKNALLTRAGERHVNAVTAGVMEAAASMLPISEQQLSDETRRDDDLQQVMEALETGRWYKIRKELQSVYEPIKTELTITDSNILMRGHRICVPKSLQEGIVKQAHEGHQGITRTKQLLRAFAWFPKMDRMVEAAVQQCDPCQVSTRTKQQRAPLQMSKLPNGPWEQLSADFYTFPSAQELLVLIDEYSRFPIVEPVASTSHKQVIPKLDNIFSTFGIPKKMRSDNGPPFNGNEFAKFADELGIVHRKVMPLWPEANGEVERFMQTLGKTIRTAAAERKPWQPAVVTFLRNYRATPHPATGRSPAELMFGRANRTKMPDLQHADHVYKERIKAAADERRQTREHNFKVGDKVSLLKTKKLLNKTEPHYETEPYTIIEVKETMITARNAFKTVTRNSALFKKKVEAVAWFPVPQDNGERIEEVPEFAEPNHPEQQQHGAARRGRRRGCPAAGPRRTSTRRAAPLPDRYNEEEFEVTRPGRRN